MLIKCSKGMTTSSPFMFGDQLSNDLLINHFLNPGNDDEFSRITKLDDIHKFDPWELPFVLGVNANEREGFFSSPLYAKNPYANNGRINRSTKSGSWQAKGKPSPVRSELTEEVIATKKVYVHSCIRDGIKWVMHEYSEFFGVPNQNDPVLFQVIKKPDKIVQRMKRKAKLPYEKDQKTDNSPCDNGETDWLATIASKNCAADTFPEQVNHEMVLPSCLQSSPVYNQPDCSPDFSPDQPENPTEKDQGTFLLELGDDFSCELDNLLRSHLESSPGYDQLGYSPDCALDQPQKPTEQDQGTSLPEPAEDFFSGLESSSAWGNNTILSR